MGNLLKYSANAYQQTLDLKNKPRPKDDDGSVYFQKQTAPPAPPSAESKIRRVAKFLILIGSDNASSILAELDPDQVEEISREIAQIKSIKPEERDEIFAEFRYLFSRPVGFTGSSRGGIETARRILYAAKGAEKGEEILNNAIPASKENLFAFLEDFSAEQLTILLKNETPQTTALILSRLSPKISAETISKLPSNSHKSEILKRMAYQNEVMPEVLEQIAEALREKVRHIASSANDIKIDGMQALAAILKHGDYGFGDKIISELEQDNPEIGTGLKEKLYSLDDVINADDRPIQEKLKKMSDQEIALLLKGRSRDFSDKILSCVSAGRRKVIREEYEIMGAVPKKDCDTAAGDFLAWFRDARERGEIILTTDDDVFV